MIKNITKEIIISSILPLIYFIIVCPISILLRLVNREFIPRSFDKNKNSYWLSKNNVKHVKKKREAEDFYKQF